MRRQEVEEINMGEKVYYKKDKEDKWRNEERKFVGWVKADLFKGPGWGKIGESHSIFLSYQ